MGTKYASDYVNKLHSMVGRHNMFVRPYRFVVLTAIQIGIAFRHD